MIELSDMRLGYAGCGRTVLDIKRLSLEQSKVTAIVGRNGSGKSTLLKAIVGLVPCAGTIALDGRGLSCMGHRERALEVAYLPQTPPVPKLDVFTLVSHGRFAREGVVGTLGRHDLGAMRSAMELADVWELRDRMLGELSGGERQRAYLAMVIAQQTPMLLADEPTSQLDVAHVAQVTGVLRRLAEDGRGVVVTSHDLPAAFASADRLVVLGDGGVCAEGTPDELMERQDVLVRALGVGVRRMDVPGMLYPYVLTRPCHARQEGLP